MRPAAVLAIVVFVAWCAAFALAGEPKLGAELAQARYYVAAPVAATAPVSASEDAFPLASTLPPPSSGSGAVVAFTADRGTAVQVTPTVPPPARPPVDGDCESWRPLLTKYGIPYDTAARIMARESGCSMAVNYNPATRDDSLCAFQLNRWGALDAAWTAAGFPRSYMATPEGCVDAAALYYHACGWGPWIKPYDCPGGWPL
jgi:hypothetical protein